MSTGCARNYDTTDWLREVAMSVLRATRCAIECIMGVAPTIIWPTYSPFVLFCLPAEALAQAGAFRGSPSSERFR
jgi:hypothetical protein